MKMLQHLIILALSVVLLTHCGQATTDQSSTEKRDGPVDTNSLTQLIQERLNDNESLNGMIVTLEGTLYHAPYVNLSCYPCPLFGEDSETLEELLTDVNEYEPISIFCTGHYHRIESEGQIIQLNSANIRGDEFEDCPIVAQGTFTGILTTTKPIDYCTAEKLKGLIITLTQEAIQNLKEIAECDPAF